MTHEDREIVDCQGTVKWFDPKKGFGFVVGPDQQDIFIHYSKIIGEGFRVLKDGSAVTYSATLTDKGWHATKVERTDPEEAEIQVVAKRAHARSPRR
ncbi:MAG: cold shock domain-containing protein [Pyrinomonadaceae bacterium]|nr:cold shock domain-containing protein [Phycisphaerales bacterium]